MSRHFVPLIPVRSLKEGLRKKVRYGSRTLLVIHSGGETHIIDATCPHDGASLVKGAVAQGCIRCPKHRIVFSLSDGQARGGEAVADVPPLIRYGVAIEGGRVGFVDSEA